MEIWYSDGMSEQVKTVSLESVHPSEDVILERLHRCTEGHADCSETDAKTMHKDFEECEAFEMYKAYTENHVPSLLQMSTTIATIIEKVPANLLTDPEAAKVIKLLKGRPLTLHGATRSYAESVIKFVRLRTSGAALRDPEVFVKIDHERRRRHDNLLRSLSDTLQLFRNAEDLGVCEKQDYHEWNPGDAVPITESCFPIFSEAAIANRDLIKNWALAADFAEQYRKLEEILMSQRSERSTT